MIRQHKYPIGTKLKTSEAVIVKGNRVEQDLFFYVIGVEMVSTDSGFMYHYKLGSSLPRAYHEPVYKSVHNENTLDSVFEVVE